MSVEAYIISAIVGIFAVLLVVKVIANKDFCVLCASVSLVWITLLGFVLMGNWKDTEIVGVLMGTSLTGIYYFLESRVKKDLLVFRLPFFVSGLGVIFGVVQKRTDLAIWIIIILLWVSALMIYLLRANDKIKNIVKSIIECCRKW